MKTKILTATILGDTRNLLRKIVLTRFSNFTIDKHFRKRIQLKIEGFLYLLSCQSIQKISVVICLDNT